MRQTIFILTLVILLNGCVAVVAGAGAGGGYYVGKDERSFGRIIDDSVITSRVNMAFIGDDKISSMDINVDTHEGTVYLYGKILDDKEEQEIIKIVKNVHGVKNVVSKLEEME